ncbi:MAG: penicillin-binding protein 2, partial [Acidobacteriota bacterium]|nr:penicillin-binding protein 2 [Acidobacteriota bacterium]
MAARRKSAKTKTGMQTAFVRFMLVVAFFIFWMGAVSVRLVHLQVNEHSKWSKKASSQRQDSIVTKTLRGTVYDRNGNTLAMSVRVKSLSADPGMIENLAEVSQRLGRILGKKASDIAAAIEEGKAGDRRFVWLAREIDDEKVVEIREKLFETEDETGETLGRGLFWVGEQKRDYPHGTLAAHVIGFSNADDIGQAGIEKSQEEYLKAEKLRMVRQRDRQGRIFSEIELEKNPAKDVVVTISKEIQHIAERALLKGIKATRAKSGKAIVLDPKTGEILAMANYPTFDPAEFRKLKPGIWRNRSIQDQYAPGSVFKLVTYGAALEEGLIRPQGEIECGDGAITVGGYTFRDSHPVGTVSYTKAMAQSSNVGAIKTGLKIGSEKYYDYARHFGFGQKTGIGLPSEATGVLRTPDKWEGTDLASMSIGYGIDVTALQTAIAFATIANDGVMVKPQIVREIQQNGNAVERSKPESRRIVKTETARALKTMLREVVANGTAKQARLNGYSSAGKTGTAWKYDRESGGINDEKYVSSFVGFAPVDNPAVVIAVVVEEPRGAFRNGGDVSAPVFREIAESILPELKIAPDA